ncbi:LacI family DNA-binding transcriptional regulator [Paenibacillus sacheonensis]|uniref:Substrate-binding domain-containing protein n=1 Tax=Paenibacillus sacheonensis TaxID=742054 RepID=A0A7X4YQ27_9BACL|nr:LacI family DNA-binding transcriptional regulator [Paenibacillus sacheonensis]MBM7565577.1 LacI family transcriptional regulator [Paenibacillus sacheonensis]NBC69504.1 substrate-binding domain-containing protein [Paenibacillus sacheonensis]
MAGKISMQQIADRLGVSKYTVSQALAGKPGVSEATRREVTALAGALGYGLKPAVARKNSSPDEILDGAHANPAAPSASAAASHGGRMILIGLDERHVVEPNFWKRVVEGLEAGCRMHGLEPRFFTFGQAAFDVHDLTELLGAEGAPARAAGFIIAGNCPLGTLLRIVRFGLPIVLADHEAPLTGADAVLNANAEAGRMACHHLLSQGCGSLVFVGRDSFAVSFRERWWGCRLALDDAKGGTGPAQLKKWTIPYGSAGTRTWLAELERRLDAAAAEGNLPQGILCANDDIALLLLQLLDAKGHRGIRVVGIDNTAAGMEAAVPLTTVDLAKERLGIRAVEAFVRKLEQPGARPEKIVLSARLVVRSSG